MYTLDFVHEKTQPFFGETAGFQNNILVVFKTECQSYCRSITLMPAFKIKFEYTHEDDSGGGEPMTLEMLLKDVLYNIYVF